MFIIKKEKKKVNIGKIIALTAVIAAGVAAIVTAVHVFKKRKQQEKKLTEEIDAAIAAAMAEEDAVTAEVQITETKEV